MKVLIDNGHGYETKGKGSPDGKFKEAVWTRKAAIILQKLLEQKGLDAELLVPETYDVSLTCRVDRVNKICKTLGADNVLLVSLHNDAVGMGDRWRDAQGFSVRVSKKASQASRKLASLIYSHISELGAKYTGNRCTPKNGYWEQNLYICDKTLCPAVLAENLFMDNISDVQTLNSTEGTYLLMNAHADAIEEYIKEHLN